MREIKQQGGLYTDYSEHYYRGVSNKLSSVYEFKSCLGCARSIVIVDSAFQNVPKRIWCHVSESRISSTFNVHVKA